MSDFSRSSVSLDVAPGERRSTNPTDPDRPFRILILGDFSGRANRGIRAGLGGRKPFAVDRDNFDDVMRGMRPQLEFAQITLQFSELDDFHPDRIYAKSGKFQAFAEERQRSPAAATSPARAEPLRPPASSAGLLDTLLDEAGEEPQPALDDAGDLATFLKKVTAPHLVPREDPRQKEQAARADSAAASAMAELLHHPHFQALEAVWRAVFLLVRGLETDGDLKLYLFDATLNEIAADTAGTAKLFSGGDGWAVIVGDYVFEQNDTYAKVLGALGRMASAAGAPFIAEGTPPAEPVAGSGWEALRRAPEAHSIGLALPRFLLRLPYGPETSPVESFEFNEMPRSVHQHYLWGNPAFCCAYLLGQAFLKDGWHMRPGSRRQIDGIPLHVYQEDGQPQMKPCAEVLMTEKDADLIMERGMMPLASMKDQDAVLLVRFQSIADPVGALSGGWN